MNSRLVLEWMKKERWTAASLGRELGVDPSTMGRYLNKKTKPPKTMLIVLASMMGVPVTAIISESQQRAG